MEKFVPYEKLSKKKKKELNAKRRQTWGINPVTRKPQNPKAYNRKKARKRDPEDFTDALSFFYSAIVQNTTGQQCLSMSFNVLSRPGSHSIPARGGAVCEDTASRTPDPRRSAPTS